MGLKTPSFWYEQDSVAARALGLLSPFYAAGSRLRQVLSTPYRAEIPVLCIGNIVAGGSGKTPVALAVMKIIRESGLAGNPCFLTRGYGGMEKGPLLVDPAFHTAQDVGDEPLLLARQAPVIVSANRKIGAQYAENKGFDLIVMDDGMQNPSLRKDCVLMVVDGASGFGNGRLLPAGPLREKLAGGLGTADGFVLIGQDAHGTKALLPPEKPVFAANLAVSKAWGGTLRSPVIAFCGLGRPEKFWATLRENNAHVLAFHAFPDHHRYTARDLDGLADEAARKKARLITTEKDAVRLPAAFARDAPLDILPVAIAWDDEKAVSAFLKTRGKRQ